MNLIVHPGDLSQSTPHSDEAAGELYIVQKIENEMRSLLLMGLSFARQESLKLSVASAERLIDNITKAFHPDQLRDEFEAGFAETKDFLEEELRQGVE